jgi:hypothetical protein
MIQKCLFFLLIFLSSQLSALEIDLEACEKQLKSDSPEVDCSFKISDDNIPLELEFKLENKKKELQIVVVSSLICRISLKFNKGTLMKTLLQTSKIKFEEEQTIACDVTLPKKQESFKTKVFLKPSAVLTKKPNTRYLEVKEIDLGVREISGIDKTTQKILRNLAKKSSVLEDLSSEINQFVQKLDR